jgi:hypothetical protein
MAAQRAFIISMTQLKFTTKQKCLENMIRYNDDLVIYVFVQQFEKRAALSSITHIQNRYFTMN